MKKNFLVITAVACVAVLGTGVFIFGENLNSSQTENGMSSLKLETNERAVKTDQKSMPAPQTIVSAQAETAIVAEMEVQPVANSSCPAMIEGGVQSPASPKSETFKIDVCGSPLETPDQKTAFRQNIVRVAGSNADPEMKQSITSIGLEKKRALGSDNSGLPTQTDPNGFISLPPQSNGLQKTSDYS